MRHVDAGPPISVSYALAEEADELEAALRALKAWAAIKAPRRRWERLRTTPTPVVDESTLPRFMEADAPRSIGGAYVPISLASSEGGRRLDVEAQEHRRFFGLASDAGDPANHGDHRAEAYLVAWLTVAVEIPTSMAHWGLMEAPTVPPRTPARRRLFKCVVAVGIGLVGVAVLALVLNGEDDTLRLHQLPEGVTAHELGGGDVFIIRDGNDVRVFLSDARHLPGDTLWWCPNEQIFIEVEHGSMFDRQGRKIGGPAAGGLNQYEVRTHDGELIVDRGEVIVGGVTPRGEAPAALDDADFSRPFNSGPGSFCQNPVASPPEAVRAFAPAAGPDDPPASLVRLRVEPGW